MASVDINQGRGRNVAKRILRKKPANAKQREAAVRKAYDLLARTIRPKETHVMLKPEAVHIQPELFQPRGFFLGLYELDTDHVKKLMREIRIKGELEPILAIKIGDAWVCIDGHHRLEAYKRNEWQHPITCKNFRGDIREAVDESIRCNAVIKLEVTQPDRLQEAWRRVVIGWGSKATIVKLCGVSDGVLAKMRRAKVRHEDTDEFAKMFRKRLGKRLDEASWRDVHAAYLSIEPKVFDERDAAAKFARTLRSRFHDKLSRDPAVTALALAIYDPTLPEKLKLHLGTLSPEEVDDVDGEELGRRMADAEYIPPQDPPQDP